MNNKIFFGEKYQFGNPFSHKSPYGQILHLTVHKIWAKIKGPKK